MAATDYFFDLTNQQFITSMQQPAVLNTVSFFYGSVRRIRVKFVTRTSAQQVTAPTASGWAVQMAIGNATADNSPVVDTSAIATGPDSEGFFLFTLYFNLAAVATAIGAANDQVQRDLEFQITPMASEPDKYQTKCILRSRLITTTLTDPIPPAVAISVAEAMATFVPRDGSNTAYPCSSFIMLDQNDNTKRYLVGIQDGQWHYDQII